MPAGTPATPVITAIVGGATAASITLGVSATATSYLIEGQKQGGTTWVQLANKTAAGAHELPIPAADWGKWMLRVTAADENGTPSKQAVAANPVIVGTPTLAAGAVTAAGGPNGALRVTVA